MAWITTILGAAAGGELREAYLKVRAARGEVASIFQVHGVHPQVMTAHLELYQELMFWTLGIDASGAGSDRARGVGDQWVPLLNSPSRSGAPSARRE